MLIEYLSPLSVYRIVENYIVLDVFSVFCPSRHLHAAAAGLLLSAPSVGDIDRQRRPLGNQRRRGTAHQTRNWVIGSSFTSGSPGHHFHPAWDPSFSGFRKNAQNAKHTFESWNDKSHCQVSVGLNSLDVSPCNELLLLPMILKNSLAWEYFFVTPLHRLFTLDWIGFYSAPDWGAEYCDDRVCPYVCLRVYVCVCLRAYLQKYPVTVARSCQSSDWLWRPPPKWPILCRVGR